MTGPRRIVCLDGVPRECWQLDARCAVIWRKRLWFIEQTKCAVCIRAGEEDNFTFASTETRPSFHCLEHGELVEIPFVVKRVYVVTIGGAVTEGERSFEDSLYIPREMLFAIRNLLIESLLAEAEEFEIARIAT